MTRATLYLFTDKQVTSSCEYNGDGYPEGYGVLYMELLERTKTVKDFTSMVQQFNSLTFKYEGKIIYHEIIEKHFNSSLGGKKIIDLNKADYNKVYFSDWIFLKNISSNIISVVTCDKTIRFIKPSEQLALYFGQDAGCYTSVSDCRNKYEIPPENDCAYGVRKLMFGEVSETILEQVA